MYPTLYGVIVIIAGMVLYFRPAAQTLGFVAVCTLFAGAAAVDLPALGGSSIPPALLALAFLGLRLLRRDVMRTRALAVALEKNAWLLIFCIYCAATALILPRMFAGKVDLIPMGASGLGFVPLRVTAQNTTTAVYLLGTGFVAAAATAVGTLPKSLPTMIKVFITVTWIHIGTGLADEVLSLVHLQGVFDIFRNGSYAQLDQGVGSLHRISALCPEPSVYATLGTVYFVFMCELWLRGIASKRTGPAALVMLLVLVLTTSSSAYIAIAAYGMLLIVRSLFIPGSITADRAINIIIVSILGVTGALVLMIVHPALATELGGIIADMTVNKAQSHSGVERASWAKQGFTALAASHGLGVGVGSFRSSSLITAILGSVGPAGLLVFIGYCVHVAKVTRKSSYIIKVDERKGAGAAAAWTAIIVLAPEALTWASSDPGLLFALMAGLSLGWRANPVVIPDRRLKTKPTAGSENGVHYGVGVKSWPSAR